MRYMFSDIENDKMIESSNVLFIFGPHDIFNNIVVDKVRNACYKEESTEIEYIEKDMDEFGISEDDEERYGNNVDFDTFMEVSSIPSITGLWYTRFDIDTMDNRRKVKLKNYLKKPNKYGKIVAVGKEYKQYKEFLDTKEINRTTNINYIQLRYPNRKGLSDIVYRKFSERGYKVAEDSVRYFIMVMSNSYDRYDEVIDMICKQVGYTGLKPSVVASYKAIKFDVVKESLKEEANFLIDDLLKEIVKPLKNNKIQSKRKIYKIYGALEDSMGDKEIIRQLIYRLEDIIALRVLINSGEIPILAKYSVTEVKSKLSDNNRVKKINDYRFKVLADIASGTSLQDWVFIKITLIKSSINYMNNIQSFRIVYNLIHRSVLDISRIKEGIDKDKFLNFELDNINKVEYNEDKLLLKRRENQNGKQEQG